MNFRFNIALVFVFLVSSSAWVMAADSDRIEPQYHQLLRDLVDINTDTSNIAGIEAARQLLIPKFVALGMQVIRHRLGQTGREVLEFTLPNARAKVMFVGHLDTVFAESSLFRNLSEQPGRLVGPGVIDMKGGVVLMLNVLSRLKETGRLDQVSVVLNDDEEIGSPSSKDTLRRLAKDIPYGLVFEPGLADGSVISSQSGVRWVRLSSKGKLAHAGLEPENGIDACRDIAQKITQITELAEPERGLTINPGVMEGGSKPNVVCENASVTFDVRFRDQQDWVALLAAIKRIANQSAVHNLHLQQGPITSVTQLAELPLLPEGKTIRLRQLLAESATALGQTITARPVGYGSDGNNLAVTNMQLLVGIGPYGGGMHSEQEFMQIDAYIKRLDLVTHIVNRLTD